MSAGFSSSSDHRHHHPHPHPHTMDKENLFNDFFYDFASPYSSDSESEDDDVAGLTRRFSRSASLHEPLFNFKEKRVFSGSPESTLGWSGFSHSHKPSPPPFLKSNEEAWNLIYAAAGQVARMKMMTSISNGTAEAVANKSSRGVIGAPRAFEHPYHSPWGRSDGEEFFRQQQFCRSRGASAWPPQLQNQRLEHHHPNQHKPCEAPVMKPVVLCGSGGGCGSGATPAKRECAGTGVFLPRRYRNNIPESRKRQAGSINLPARMIQSSTKTFVPIITQPQIQARINGGFVPHYEMLVGRRNAMIVAAQQQRRSNNIHGGFMESPANNPEVLLPQEWTY